MTRTIKFSETDRVLYLTKDPELIRGQLAGKLRLTLSDVKPEDLLDDINTDAMTPAWVCFSHLPAEIALNAYAGLMYEGKRIFAERALMDGGFVAICSGKRKGTGSSRETAAQCEKFAGIDIVFAESFAPIHARNNINQGTLMGGYDLLARFEAGEEIPVTEFTKDLDPISAKIVELGGLFNFERAVKDGAVKIDPPSTTKRAMTLGEKLIAKHAYGASDELFVKPGDILLVNVDGGYSHEFTTAQVHVFLEQEYGSDYKIVNPDKFAVFEDHLIYTDVVPKFEAFAGKIQTLRDLQVEFQKHTGVRDYSAKDGVSPGICHQVAREKFIEPGDFIQATDSHTCMGGSQNALAFGVGATEYAALIHAGFTSIKVPESIRFELIGGLAEGVTAKDLILFILQAFAKNSQTLDRIMEFTGPGVATLSIDERATVANMATECTAKTAIFEGDDKLAEWIAARQTHLTVDQVKAKFVSADEGAQYAGGVHTIDLASIRPMVATPGDAEKGIPSDPTNGALVADLGDVKIDIAYGGSCTAGKEHDLDLYASVVRAELAKGKKVAEGVKFYIQYGSHAVEEYAKKKGYVDDFLAAGVELIPPGCGACIGCGPGISSTSEQVTVSAINRNFSGRSGPGKLYLASPLTVAKSAFEGKIASASEL
ncbi:MAG: aconitase family protein [Planctomycetes bacterium]|nr:aconitase family protein [Planctomycetota bacterium]